MRTNDLFLTAAAASMMMLAACTHDDGGSVVTTPTPASNEIVISTSASKMGITRSDETKNTTDFQDTQFQSGEYIDVFMQDATRSSETDTTGYDSPVRYKADGSGNLATYSYTTSTGRTYDETKGRPLYWPKKMHDLQIYGVYPVGSVGFDPHKTDCTNAATYDSGLKAFDKDFEYYFTVQEDQTSEANYKLSDLMIGLPSEYKVNSVIKYTAPFLLDQVENPGNIPLLFQHRLTKIIVNVATSKETNDISIDNIKYTGGEDKKYARITLMNTKRKTWFKVYGTSDLDEVVADRAIQVATLPNTDKVIIGRGQNTIPFTIGETGSHEYTALSLAAVVPPQVIDDANTFIKVELIDEDIAGDNKVYDTFLYSVPSDLTLLASKVYTFNIRINKPNIIVTTEINDWTNGGINNAIGVLQ